MQACKQTICIVVDVAVAVAVEAVAVACCLLAINFGMRRHWSKCQGKL